MKASFHLEDNWCCLAFLLPSQPLSDQNQKPQQSPKMAGNLNQSSYLKIISIIKCELEHLIIKLGITIPLGLNSENFAFSEVLPISHQILLTGSLP